MSYLASSQARCHGVAPGHLAAEGRSQEGDISEDPGL